VRELRRLVAIARGLVRRNGVADEIREEMRLHVELRAEEYARQGLDAAEAERAARRRFGNAAVHQDAGYDIRGAGVWDSLSQDVRYAARRLRATPGFTIAAVVTLALGIGANSAIFSLMNGLLLRRVPGADLHRIAAVSVTRHGIPQPVSSLSRDERQSLDAHRLETIESFFTSDPLIAAVSAAGRSRVVSGEVVSGTYFASLGITPVAGRLLTPDDDRDVGDGTPVVISERLWREWFAVDPAAMGAVLKVAGQTFTVVGVAPDDFNGTWLPTMIAADVWIPLPAADRVRTIQGPSVDGPHRTFATLRTGVSFDRAAAAITVVGASVESSHADGGLMLIAAERAILFDDFRQVGLAIGTALLSISLLVLLIACANLTNLILARAVSRAPEVATRLALGAGRWRVFRLLLIESVLVAAIAGVCALLVTRATTWLMLQVPLPSLDGIAIRFDPTPDWSVFGYALAVTVIAALSVGLLPAWRASRTDPMKTLAASGLRGSESRRGRRVRTMLVAAQVAMSVVLLLVAALYLRSAHAATRFDPGFDVEHGVVASVDLRLQQVSEARGRRLQRDMAAAARTLPGVQYVVLASGIGPVGHSTSTGSLLREGAVPNARGFGIVARYASISPGALQALHIPLRRGREFSEHDVDGAPRVAIVSDELAARCWPDENPLGRRFRLTANGPLLEVVGVAGGVRARPSSTASLDPFVYVPLEQEYSPQISVIAVTKGDPRSLVEPLRASVTSVEPEMAVMATQTLADGVGFMLAPLRVTALVLATLGAIGLGLAVVGLHGVVTYFVSERTRELGIRRALGATRAGIYVLVLRAGLVMLLSGVAVGVPIAFALSGLLRNLLFGIAPHDPVTFVGVPLALVAVGLASSCIAARRAARIEPSEALREL
jgi:predicted permease